MKTTVICIALLSWSLSAPAAQPQPEPPYRVDWFTMDAGGGQGSGGDFTLLGSFGQPDAGQQIGGDYRLVGGFWGIMLQIQQPTTPPDLHITLAGSEVVISWPSSATAFHLEESMSIAPLVSWNPVLQTPILANGKHTVTVPAADARFYRLRTP